MCSDDDDDHYVQSNPYEEEMVRQAESRWQEYQQMYVPMENDLIRQIEGYRGEGYQQSMKDEAVNAARMNTPGTVTAGAGMDPGSGTFMAQSIGAEQQSGTAGALGAMSGLQTAEDQYVGGMMNMAQVGRQQSATSMSGMGNLASMQAGVDAAEMAAQQQANSAMWGAIGTGVGAGVGYGMDQWGSDPKKKTVNPVN